MSVHKTARLCEHCEQPMTDPKILRRRHPVTNGRVCLDCLDINVPEWGPRLAHDGGTSVPNHCPFCGSGAVISGADGTIECGYCDSNFIVKVQPKHNGAPQTPVNGDEGEWTPDMGDPGITQTAPEELPFGEEPVEGESVDGEEPAAEFPFDDEQTALASLRALAGYGDGTGFCMKCLDDDLPVGMLCRRGDHPFIDNGPSGGRDPEVCQYEGVCLRCCGHNHG